LAPFAALCLLTTLSIPRTGTAAVTYLLGDIDNCHYNGPSSVDHVYYDPAWVAQAANKTQPLKAFDIGGKDKQVPFTFLFNVPYTITGASLQLGLRAEDTLISTDVILVDSSAWHIKYLDLGWVPLSLAHVEVRTLDLSNVLGANLLPSLQDGQLNILLADDVTVDYAALTIQYVIPVPRAIDLSILGAALVTVLCRRRSSS
jgi:hypothetical protein